MEEIYRRLIVSWREASEALTPDERSGVSNLVDFRAPCQLDVVLLENRSLDVTMQLWMFSHFEDMPDLSVVIHGPVGTFEANAKLAQVVRSIRFDRALPDKTRFLGATTYRDLVESHILGLVESFREALLRNVWSGQPQRAGVRLKQFMSEQAFIWQYEGVLDQEAIDRIIAKLSDDARQYALRKKETRQAKATAEKRNEIKVKGTYIYPHVWIGSRPSHSFENDLNERIYGRRIPRVGFAEPVLFDRLGRLCALATHDGLVAFSLEDNFEALRILNSFMSLLTLRGIPALAVRENELAELTLDPSTGKVIGSNMSIIQPRMLPSDPSFIQPRWQEERMPVVEVSLVQEICHSITAILDDNTSLDLLQLFGEVYTHFQRSEYHQTVLMAWALVEKWYLPIRERAIRLGKLSRTPRSPRMADIMDLLDDDLLEMAIATQIFQLWRLRSEVVHRSTYVTKEEAQTALAIAVALLESPTSGLSLETVQLPIA